MWIFPLALTVMLLLSLEINEETGQYTANAITWTVVARFIQGSPWATILSTDISAVKRVKGLCGMKCTDLGRVTAITQGAWAISILLTISGIVTPLGLYDKLALSGPESVSFHYVKDDSIFGEATTSRDQFKWYRNETILLGSEKLVEVFSSGTSSFGDTISGPFNIQPRTFKKESRSYMTNSSEYPVKRFHRSLLLKDDIYAIEGLIVDTRIGNASVGFRNHTIPQNTEYGGSWNEVRWSSMDYSDCTGPSFHRTPNSVYR